MPTRLFPLVVLLACAISAADEKPAVKLDSAVVRKLVEQLASDDFATRERATQELSNLEEAPEALREATKSNDLEVRKRAQTAVDAITARAENKVFKELGRWTQIDDFNANDPHDAIVVEDKVIVGTDQGQLRAYRCEDGKSIWVHHHGARIFHSPCSDGQRIYFSSAKGVTAVKAEDGSEVWSFGLASCDGPTFVLSKQGTVFVGGNDGNLYALEAKTGKQTWASDFIADAPPDPPDFSGERARVAKTKARPSALASDGETLFLSVFDQCRIVAVSAADGKRLWSFQARGWVYGSAVATQKHVFFGSKDETFYCLDKQTGKKVWSHKTKGRIESGGAVDGKFVYFGSCDGGLYCLNQSDGKERWRFATDQRDGHNSAIYSVPLLHKGGVYFAAGEGQAYAVNQDTGELKWKLRPSKGSELYCSPATDGKRFFLVTRAQDKEHGEPSLVAIGLK
ncbi:MAG: PQQ-binding-like beta-propeller repeat protein [Planctomycetales bacterium]|nr:PQQ-binding-like beta-propeller repeat protein [Planctomycetales bacterium]